MTVSRYLLIILVFFSIFFFKNRVLSFYWSVFSQVSLLPFLIWSVCINEKRWYLSLVCCLLPGFLLDIFFFSAFGIHLLVCIGLFSLAQAWISLFSTTSGSLLGFFFMAPMVDLVVVSLVQFLGVSVRLSAPSLLGMITLSILLNLFLIFAWLFLFPVKEIDYVE